MRRPLAWALVVVVAAVAAGACGTSGRTLRAPAEGGTIAPRVSSSSTTQPPTLGTPGGITLTTDAWSAGGALPDRYTCEGLDVSPPLAVRGVPAGTVELALVVGSTSATSWVVTAIDPATTAIAEGQAPPGAVLGATSSGEVGWSGPCDPGSAGTQTYEFALHALAAPSGVTEGMAPAEATELILNAPSLGTSLVTGTFRGS